VSDQPAAPAGPAKNGAIFEAENVVKRFGGIRAVNGATMKVQRGSITALIGPNGAGKTTFFNLITGFYRADMGAVNFDGVEIAGKPPYAIARLGMVRTFQITKALAAMPVIDNMMLAAPNQPGEKLRNIVFRPAKSRAREKEVREEAMELLEVFNLTKLADAYAGTLSGGQRKLLDLARVLMLEPSLVLLDEPMAGVSPALRVELLEHILAVRRDRKITFLIVEHDLDFVMRAADRVVVMNEGRVLVVGAPDEVRTNEQVVDAYLGTAH
jgi:neutral amino acid transport system ATP-binding protein